MRHAPSVDIVPALLTVCTKVSAYDPKGMRAARHLLGDIKFCDGPYKAAAKSDARVVSTERDHFRALDFGRIKNLMATPIVRDLRNIYNPTKLRRDGLKFESIGRA